MKRVSLRDFQLKPTKFLKELPIVLTQYNKDVATVVPYNENVLTHVLPEPQDAGWLGQCQAPNQHCKQYGSKYVVTFSDGESIQRLEQYLCANHLVTARQEAELVEAYEEESNEKV